MTRSSTRFEKCVTGFRLASTMTRLGWWPTTWSCRSSTRTDSFGRWRSRSSRQPHERSNHIEEAKTHLSEYLPRIEAGETILLCRRNVPIAEIRPLPSVESPLLPEIGFAKGTFTIPDEFFEPLIP
jgi:antitoxin (DNA-binding transcriptional repressor) of toxin-antitoxin stability system